MKRGMIYGVLITILLIGVVSAWNVDITKLNGQAVDTKYPNEITTLSYTLADIDCANISKVWYSPDGGFTKINAGCSQSEIILTGLNSDEGNNSWVVIV